MSTLGNADAYVFAGFEDRPSGIAVAAKASPVERLVSVFIMPRNSHDFKFNVIPSPEPKAIAVLSLALERFSKIISLMVIILNHKVLHRQHRHCLYFHK